MHKSVLDIIIKENVVIFGFVCFQGATILHPKTGPLSLIGEKVLGVTACNVRASVWTESGKVSNKMMFLTMTIVTKRKSHIIRFCDLITY